MNILLKQRLIGAIVLISLAVIFLPMLFTGKGEQEQKFESSIPPEPVYEIKSPQVSVPLSLPATTMEKVPLREPLAKDDPVTAKPDIQAVSENTDLKTPATEPLNPESPKPQQSIPQIPAQASDSPKKPPAASPPLADSTPAPIPDTVAVIGAPLSETIEPSDVTGWVVQVGSFSQKANAEKLRDKLRKMDMASFVVTGTSDKKTVYRVRVGPEINRGDAEKIQAKIKEKTKLKGLVMKYP